MVNTYTQDNFKTTVYKSVQEIRSNHYFESDEDIFKSLKYWKLLEANPPKGINQVFTVAYDQDVVLGVFYFQLVPFHMKDHLQYKYGQNASKWKLIKDKLRGFVARLVNVKILVAGNMLHTGENGVSWKMDITDKEKISIWNTVINQTWEHLEKENGKIDLCLAKDFEVNAPVPKSVFPNADFSLYRFQPAMLLSIDESWNTMDDYLEAITSKYRVRYRRARKKMAAIEKRVLTNGELQKHKNDIYQLYKNVADTVEFNLFYLDENHYVQLEEQFRPETTIFGYFEDDILIGFAPVMENNGTLEGLFLGFDERKNSKYHLYHNFLFDILEEGIKRGCHTVDYARTALEIKSSLGAEPHQLDCYLKHRNPLINRTIHRAVQYFTPIYKWEQRRPFKANPKK